MTDEMFWCGACGRRFDPTEEGVAFVAAHLETTAAGETTVLHAENVRCLPCVRSSPE